MARSAIPWSAPQGRPAWTTTRASWVAKIATLEARSRLTSASATRLEGRLVVGGALGGLEQLPEVGDRAVEDRDMGWMFAVACGTQLRSAVGAAAAGDDAAPP